VGSENTLLSLKLTFFHAQGSRDSERLNFKSRTRAPSIPRHMASIESNSTPSGLPKKEPFPYADDRLITRRGDLGTHRQAGTLIWSCDWSERGCDEALPYRGAMVLDGVAPCGFSFISLLGRRTPVRLIVTAKRQIVVQQITSLSEVRRNAGITLTRVE
jgi:hypothetical protein